MKVVFIGSVIFSNSILEYLIRSTPVEIVGVCTKKSSTFNSDFYDLGKICKKYNIKFIYCKDINNSKIMKWIKSKSPDYIFCFGWSELLSLRVLKIPRISSIGYHPSELPKNRGRHPIIWSLSLGLKYAGSSFFVMGKKPDTGKVLIQDRVKIDNNDNAHSLYVKLTNKALKQIKPLLKILKKNNIKNEIKSENKLSNYWRKRSYKDGEIDWRMSSKNIYNLTRALHKPYPNSHFIFKSKKIEIIEAKRVIYKNNNIEPGKVLSIKNNNILIKCGDNALLIKKYKPKTNLKKNDYLI